MRINEGLLKKEEDFHDGWARSVDLDKVLVVESFEAPSACENRYFLNRVGDLKGKRVLDLGCGLGESAVYFALKGARVTASDLSAQMLNVTKALAQKHGVEVQTLKSPSHALAVSSGSFDLVYAANVLHHVELEGTLREIKRVLKKGGMLVSWDPLAHNPLINVYRRMAKEVRTADEHPLKLGEVAVFKKYFKDVEVKAFWFFTLLIFVKFYLVDRIDPNKERYWKKIIYDYKKFARWYVPLEKIDRFVLKVFPFLSRYCWNMLVLAKNE